MDQTLLPAMMVKFWSKRLKMDFSSYPCSVSSFFKLFSYISIAGQPYVIIVAFFGNATIEYSLESVCVCVCVCVFVCVCLHDNSKRNQSRNTKLEYAVVYEDISDKFDIGLRRIKVKVTVGIQRFFPFTTIQTVRSCISTVVQARNLMLNMNVHLILIYKIYVVMLE